MDSEPSLPSQPQIERFALIGAGETPTGEVDHHVTWMGEEAVFNIGSNASGGDGMSPLTFTARPALLGAHNVVNALVASIMAWHAGVDGHTIRTVVERFGGVKRRMEVHLDHPSAVYVDDYAHHPTELKPCLMPCGFVGQTEKSHLCSSHICTQGPAILAWNLPKFWGKPMGCCCSPFTRHERHPFQALMHNGCLITSQVHTHN